MPKHYWLLQMLVLECVGGSQLCHVGKFVSSFYDPIDGWDDANAMLREAERVCW